MPRVEYENLSGDRMGEPSAAIRKRVEAAHERPADVARFKGTPLTYNADTLAPPSALPWGKCARSAGVGPAEVRD